MIRAAVQEILHQPGGRGASRSSDAWHALVDFHSTTHKMDRHALPHMRDRILASVDGDRLGSGEATVAQLLEENQKPFFARNRRACVSGLHEGGSCAEVAPCSEHMLPRATHRFIQALTTRKMVVAL